MDRRCRVAAVALAALLLGACGDAGRPTAQEQRSGASVPSGKTGRIEARHAAVAVPRILNPAEELGEFAPNGILRWEDVPGATEYEVWAYADAGLTQLAETSAALTSRQYQFTRLEGGRTYHVKLYARVAGAWLEAPTAELRTAVTVTRPRLVNSQEELEAFGVGGTLRWSPVSGADVYELWVFRDAERRAFAEGSGALRITQYQLRHLAPGASYYVQVFARVNGAFHAGEAVRVTVTEQLSRARIVNPQEELDGFATDGILRWTPVTGATLYEVWVFTNPNLSRVQESSGQLGTRSYAMRTLQPGTSYYAQVYALVDGRWQVGSPVRIATGVQASRARLTNAQEQLERFAPGGTLQWTAVPGAESYEVWIYADAGLGRIVESAATSGRSHTVQRLCADATYYAQVHARVNGQWSAGWPVRLDVAPGVGPADCVPPAPIVKLTASPAEVALGQSVTLSWTTRFATSCTASGAWSGSRGIAGTESAGAEDAATLYSLTCSGPSGASLSQALVTRIPPPVVSLTASRLPVPIGEAATVTWSATRADTCVASGGWSGARQVSGSATTANLWQGTTLSLVCTGPGGIGSAQLELPTACGTGSLGDGPPVMTAAAVKPFPVPPVRSPALSGPLSRVRAYEYIVAETTQVETLAERIANSPADLFIVGDNARQPPLDRQKADPAGTKLVFGYMDLAEATDYNHPSLFVGGKLPSWFGNANPPWPGLYTVQFWHPDWQPELLATVDRIVAAGFDGIFLDVLNGEVLWSPGNIWGNPVYPDATRAMADLLSSVVGYVRSRYPDRRIYLIGAGPNEIALQYPESLRQLDALFNEIVFYAFHPNNGRASEYIGTHTADFYLRRLLPAYQAAGVPILGGDYPTPLSDSAAAFLSFDYYSALGWIPTVNNAWQTTAKLKTGPFMFMSTASSPVVTGAKCFVNFLSGGLAPQATLVGGDQGDIFIGGPGTNVITGGAGHDLIYAHPKYAVYRDRLVFTFSSVITPSATTPKVAVQLNGRTVVPSTPITAAHLKGWQSFTVDVDRGVPIQSVVIQVDDTTYVDASTFSNVQIESVLWNGVAVDLARGVFTNGANTPYGAYSNVGTVTLPAASFDLPSPYLADTSSTIDGGGGVNAVVYRGPAANYTLVRRQDGSWRVTSAATAEGPDTLVNVQSIRFADRTLELGDR